MIEAITRQRGTGPRVAFSLLALLCINAPAAAPAGPWPRARQAKWLVDSSPDGLSDRHPGDAGMSTDPSVVLYEGFSERNLGAILDRYNSYAHREGMALVPDRPAGSPGRFALRLTSNASHPSTYLYKTFWRGYEELYFRYYAKYIGNGPWHHSGVWIGGYELPLPFPYPRAGVRPSGSGWYSIGLEPIADFRNTPMDLYTYWRGMHSWRRTPTGARGNYFGNTLLHDAQFLLRPDTWVCYEMHLKLNRDPANGVGAVLEVWQNDRLVRRFDDHGPLGYWVRDKFCPASADQSECTRYRPSQPSLVPLDQRWRTSRMLKINYFWPQNYNTASIDSSLLLDDIVVATRRVGCMVSRDRAPSVPAGRLPPSAASRIIH